MGVHGNCFCCTIRIDAAQGNGVTSRCQKLAPSVILGWKTTLKFAIFGKMETGTISATVKTEPEEIEIPVIEQPHEEWVDEDIDAGPADVDFEEGEFIDQDEQLLPMDDVHPIQAACDSYRLAFPNHPLPSLEIVERKCSEILSEYRKKPDSSNSLSFGSPLTTLMALNFFQHLNKHGAEVAKAISAIAQDHIDDPGEALEVFCAQSQLSEYFHKILPQTLVLSQPQKREKQETIYTQVSLTRKKGKDDREKMYNRFRIFAQLANGRTTLQNVLRPEFSESDNVPSKGFHYDKCWKDRWHPVNLTLPIQLWCLAIGNSGLPTGKFVDSGVVTKWYIEHMAKVAESNQEFLLACISAFDICIWKYPGRVAELFQKKDMLIPTCRLESLKSSAKYNDDSAIPRTNDKLLQMIKSFPTFLPYEDDKIEKRIEPSAPDSFKFLLSFEDFSVLARRTWFHFYWKRTPVIEDTLISWYNRIEHTFERIKNQIYNCIDVIQRDNVAQRSYPIKNLSPEDVRILVEDNAGRLAIQEAKCNGRDLNPIIQSVQMRLGTTPLQLSIIDPTSGLDSVPGLKDWNRSNCNYPFQIFYHMMCKRLERKKPVGFPLRLHIVVYKIRYVEALASTKLGAKQLILGILDAFGPCLYNYPCRVLEILKTQGLLRINSKLNDPEFLGFLSKKTYETFDREPSIGRFENQGTSTFPFHELQTASKFLSGQTSLQLGSKSDFDNWISSTESVLSLLGLPLLTEFGYNEIYKRYLAYSEQTSDIFMRGVFSGICLAMRSQETQHAPIQVASGQQLQQVRWQQIETTQRTNYISQHPLLIPKANQILCATQSPINSCFPNPRAKQNFSKHSDQPNLLDFPSSGYTHSFLEHSSNQNQGSKLLAESGGIGTKTNHNPIVLDQFHQGDMLGRMPIRLLPQPTDGQDQQEPSYNRYQLRSSSSTNYNLYGKFEDNRNSEFPQDYPGEHGESQQLERALELEPMSRTSGFNLAGMKRKIQTPPPPRISSEVSREESGRLKIQKILNPNENIPVIVLPAVVFDYAHGATLGDNEKFWDSSM